LSGKSSVSDPDSYGSALKWRPGDGSASEMRIPDSDPAAIKYLQIEIKNIEYLLHNTISSTYFVGL